MAVKQPDKHPVKQAKNPPKRLLKKVSSWKDYYHLAAC
jgi:hypothetical protein